MLEPSQLHVFTARSNPLGWAAPHRNWLRFARHMLDSGVNLTVVECAYGEEAFQCDMEGVRHIGVRAKTRGWIKENLINIGVQRTPEARYVAWIDADIIFRRPDWAAATVHALQHYDVVQPWSDAYDLGPNGEHIARPPLVLPAVLPPRAADGRPAPATGRATAAHVYPHSGYAWAMTREAYRLGWRAVRTGRHGLGRSPHGAGPGRRGGSVAGGRCRKSYRREVKRWEERAVRHINRNIGYVPGTIEHLFHGKKTDRGYQSRWDMFVKHEFDPLRT